jgi:hypothetical protein
LKKTLLSITRKQTLSKKINGLKYLIEGFDSKAKEEGRNEIKCYFVKETWRFRKSTSITLELELAEMKIKDNRWLIGSL